MLNSGSSMDLTLEISDGYVDSTNTPLTTPMTPGAPNGATNGTANASNGASNGDDSGLGEVTPTPSSAPTPTSATSLSAQHFNNLSYEDFDLTTRTATNNLGSR